MKETEMTVPCKTCILFAMCADPDKFSDIFYGCSCTIMETAIDEAAEKFFDGDVHKPAYIIHEWYHQQYIERMKRLK